MRQVITYADPERAVVDILSAVFGEEAAVDVWWPASSTEQPPALPFVQVGWDGTPVDNYPVSEHATVRVTYWTAKGRYTAAKAGASRARGELLAYAGGDDVWNIQPGAGRSPGTDPDTGLPFCSFTVIVHTRPTAL